MATDTETGLAKASDEAQITQTPEYGELLAKCQEICDGARQSLLRYMWALGQEISKHLSSRRDENYGKAVVIALEKDLAIDRTTLWRAVKAFEAFPLEQIVAARQLSWSKLKMLLPLPAEIRDRVMEQIRAGDLRTDDDVRYAILEEKRGMLPPPPTDEVRGRLEGLSKRDFTALDRLWRRAEPPQRAVLVKTLIPKLDLDKAPREEAIAALNDIERSLESYRQQIEEGSHG